MASLSNTTWTLTFDGDKSGYTATITFDAASAPPGHSGGQGTYKDSNGPTPFFWTEDQNDFMFQFTNQDPGYETLTTYSGSHRAGSATGWSTNFSVGFSAQGFAMTKN